MDRRALLAGLASTALLAACEKARGGWAFAPGNPVLGGKFGVCFDPCVLAVEGGYRMWFSWRPKAAIAYAESRDGRVWSDPVVVLAHDPGRDGEIEVNRPSVSIVDGVHHMWFTSQTRERSWIGYASSVDGHRWTREENVVMRADQAWEHPAIMAACVVPYQAGFRMWYSGGGQYEPRAIGHATSADGIHWVKNAGPVFEATAANAWEADRVSAPDVHFVDGWWTMFYIGFHDIDTASIGIARSRNGVSDWMRHPANPILSPPGKSGFFAWDRDAIYKPAAVLTPQGWKMWFNARRADVEQIGLAVHGDRDLGFSG